MQPFMIRGLSGSLFAVFWPPKNASFKHAVIHVPAFAEEMNKSRRMVALQSREFSEQGVGVLILDLFGTGDSGGEFFSATWNIWQNDIQVGIEWLEQQGFNTVSLWGLRTGALLALDFVRQKHCSIKQLLCWQPVLNGDAFVTQFLRLRVAAAMMDKHAPQEKVSDLKAQLLNGDSIEVAGYSLNPDLIVPMLSLKARQFDLSQLRQCHVFEVNQSDDPKPNMPTTNWLEHLSQSDVNCSIDVVKGCPFWSSQEIVEVPELIDVTLKRVAEWH